MMVKNVARPTILKYSFRFAAITGSLEKTGFSTQINDQSWFGIGTEQNGKMPRERRCRRFGLVIARGRVIRSSTGENFEIAGDEMKDIAVPRRVWLCIQF